MEIVESDISSFEIEIRMRCKQSNKVGWQLKKILIVQGNDSFHFTIIQKDYLTPVEGNVDPDHFHVRINVVRKCKVCKFNEADLFDKNSMLHISVTLKIG